MNFEIQPIDIPPSPPKGRNSQKVGLMNGRDVVKANLDILLQKKTPIHPHDRPMETMTPDSNSLENRR